MKSENIEREKELKEKFNAYFRQLGIEDLYSQLDKSKLIELKRLLSCINNIITLRATNTFVQKLYDDGFVSDEDKKSMLYVIDHQHANTNGYDVNYGKNAERKIIAEVKCNIPVNKTSFGAAQEEGILEDIKHLLDGKDTAADVKATECYKFMAILDYGNAQVCMEKILNKTEHVKRYTTPAELDKENVFVVFV